MRGSKMFRALLITGFVMAQPASLFAQQTSADQKAKPISVQLNNAVQQETICRLSFMVRNGLDYPLENLGLEVVLLNKQALAQDFMILRTGRLISGKRRIQQFDLPDTDCAELGEILINDVSDCQGKDLTPANCLEQLQTSSKTAIKLGL